MNRGGLWLKSLDAGMIRVVGRTGYFVALLVSLMGDPGEAEVGLVT